MDKNTIIYLRTSTEEQNPENQLKDCLSINKYGEYELFQEQQSAWKDDLKRIEFNKIISLMGLLKIVKLFI